MIRAFYGAFGRDSLPSYGIFDCESLLSHLRTGKLGTEKFLTRRFRSIMDALETGSLDNAAWIPGKENPADGLTKLRAEMEPLLNLMCHGVYQPGELVQLKGASFA